jgi:hypothetical protein
MNTGDEMNIKTITIASIAIAAGSAIAQPVEIQVNVENLAPQNSVAFSPLSVSFHSGSYDTFNLGGIATTGVANVAESGNGTEWFSEFSSGDAGATLGSIFSDAGGPLTPGGTGSAVFTIDPATNQFFSFGAMVVPSNDSFIGNDSPSAYQILDSNGNLLINEITQYGNDVWDAGSELNGIFGAAFLAGSSGSDHIDENGVVTRGFAQFDEFNGLTTPAGYTFDRQFGGDDAIYRISFSVVPAPGTASLFGLGALGALRRRR